MFTASAVNGMTRGKISNSKLARLARCRTANSNQPAPAGFAEGNAWDISLMGWCRSVHQASPAEEALGTDQENDGHQGEDRHLGHFRCEQRRHAYNHPDQKPGNHGATDRAHTTND